MNRTAAFVLFLAAASHLSAQNSPVSFVPFEGLGGDLKQTLAGDKAIDEKRAEIASLLMEHTQALALYALGSSVYASLVEEARLDKQVGTSSTSAGATNLVSHGSVPSLIGVAVESGALYQSVSGSIVTFRLNPSGLVRALARNEYLLAGPPGNTAALEQGISRLSLSGSFDFQQGSSPGTFTGERSQLREATVRFDILNKRDPRHPSHAGSIQQLRAEMGPLVNTLTSYFAILKQMPGYDAWRVAAADQLAGVNVQDDTALKAALIKSGEEFTATFASNPELQKLGNTMVEHIKSYRTVRDKIFQNIAKSSILTVEYAFNKLTVPEAALAALPMGTVIPDLSSARLIVASPIGTVGEATLNGSVTIFNSTLPQMRGNLRDIQVGGSLDLRLPEIRAVGQPTLTFAGLGVFLHQQPFGVKVTLQNVETADGAIGVFQTKLTFPAGRSGVRIPVSFTVANRSEFRTEREVRGSIGVTFDLDKLFAQK